MNEKEKGDTHVTFDDESAFFSHHHGLTLSHFVSSPEDVHFQGDEFDVYRDTKEVDLQQSFYYTLFCYSVIFKIRDTSSSTMFLVHNGTDNTISIIGGYVNDKENHIECGLERKKSLTKRVF